MVTGKVALLPTETDPNESKVGLALMASLVAPVPPICTESVGFDALLKKRTVPPVHPAEPGVNVILTSTLCPAESVTGRFMGEVANADPLIAELVMVTLEFPLLVRVMSWVSLWPVTTTPKRRLAGEDVNCATHFGSNPPHKRAAPKVKS